MLYGLLVTLFVVLCFLLILIILVQKSRSSMGLGGLGGGAQMLFGGSGGQDLFQKITWVMVALFMTGSLGLALLKTRQSRLGGLYKPRTTTQPQKPAGPEVPKLRTLPSTTKKVSSADPAPEALPETVPVQTT